MKGDFILHYQRAAFIGKGVEDHRKVVMVRTQLRFNLETNKRGYYMVIEATSLRFHLKRMVASLKKKSTVTHADVIN